MIRRLLALALLTAGVWPLTQGVAHASHCGEVNYDASQSPNGNCGPDARTLQLLTGTTVAGAGGAALVLSFSSGTATVTAATGPAPAGAGPGGKGKGRTGKKTKAQRDAKSQARRTRRARKRARAQEKRARRAKAERTRDRKVKAAGKNPPPGRTEKRVTPELRMDLEHEEGAVPTAGIGGGHSSTQSRFYGRGQATSDLGGAFVQPHVNFAGAALGETSSTAPPWPASPNPTPLGFASPPDDPLAATLLGASMTLILVGQFGWDLTRRTVPPVVRWMGGWQ